MTRKEGTEKRHRGLRTNRLKLDDEVVSVLVVCQDDDNRYVGLGLGVVGGWGSVTGKVKIQFSRPSSVSSPSPWLSEVHSCRRESEIERDELRNKRKLCWLQFA